ncbi:MAG: hypothetical protein WC352_06235, partial [Candidatus Omnitrophota bacterium]
MPEGYEEDIASILLPAIIFRLTDYDRPTRELAKAALPEIEQRVVAHVGDGKERILDGWLLGMKSIFDIPEKDREAGNHLMEKAEAWQQAIRETEDICEASVRRIAGDSPRAVDAVMKIFSDALYEQGQRMELISPASSSGSYDRVLQQAIQSAERLEQKILSWAGEDEQNRYRLAVFYSKVLGELLGKFPESQTVSEGEEIQQRATLIEERMRRYAPQEQADSLIDGLYVSALSDWKGKREASMPYAYYAAIEYAAGRVSGGQLGAVLDLFKELVHPIVSENLYARRVTSVLQAFQAAIEKLDPQQGRKKIKAIYQAAWPAMMKNAMEESSDSADRLAAVVQQGLSYFDAADLSLFQSAVSTLTVLNGWKLSVEIRAVLERTEQMLQGLLDPARAQEALSNAYAGTLPLFVDEMKRRGPESRALGAPAMISVLLRLGLGYEKTLTAYLPEVLRLCADTKSARELLPELKKHIQNVFGKKNGDAVIQDAYGAVFPDMVRNFDRDCRIGENRFSGDKESFDRLLGIAFETEAIVTAALQDQAKIREGVEALSRMITQPPQIQAYDSSYTQIAGIVFSMRGWVVTFLKQSLTTFSFSREETVGYLGLLASALLDEDVPMRLDAKRAVLEVESGLDRLGAQQKGLILQTAYSEALQHAIAPVAYATEPRRQAQNFAVNFLDERTRAVMGEGAGQSQLIGIYVNSVVALAGSLIQQNKPSTACVETLRLVRTRLEELLGEAEARRQLRDALLKTYPQTIQSLFAQYKYDEYFWHKGEAISETEHNGYTETILPVMEFLTELVDPDGKISASPFAQLLTPDEIVAAADLLLSAPEGPANDDLWEQLIGRFEEAGLWTADRVDYLREAAPTYGYAKLLAFSKANHGRSVDHLMIAAKDFPHFAGGGTLEQNQAVLDEIQRFFDLTGEQGRACYLQNARNWFRRMDIAGLPGILPEEMTAQHLLDALRVLNHIEAAVRQRQPQTTNYDLFNEDAKLALTTYLLTHHHNPYRLKAVFDIYFNSSDPETHKHIDQFALKFSAKNPGAFYEEMADGARQVHRQQARKLDYYFLVPFLMNFTDDETRTAEEAELFFKLFTSKKLHQFRSLKLIFRNAVDQLDQNFRPEDAKLLRLSLRILDRKWKVSTVSPKAIDEKVPVSKDRTQYLSFAIAQNLIDFAGLLLDLKMVGAKKKDPLARDYAMEWRPRILRDMAAVLDSDQERLPLQLERLRRSVQQFVLFAKGDKLNTLYQYFTGVVQETSEEAMLNRRLLARYAATLPVNQDGHTLFDSVAQFLYHNSDRPEVIRTMHAALMSQARGQFADYRYQSNDYRTLFAKWTEAQAGKIEKPDEKQTAEIAEQGERLQAEWQKNRYYVAHDETIDGNYHIGFTDNFATILNMGNPSYFGSCQACYKPAYNRGLAGSLANGWNKIIAVFDEKGQFVARRLVRLRLTREGELVLLKEPTYGNSAADRHMDRILAKVAGEMGVRYQPDHSGQIETIHFTLWGGNSEWEYSDTYGYDDVTEAVGLLRMQGGRELSINLAVPLRKSDVTKMGEGYEVESETFFKFIADHVKSVQDTGNDAEALNVTMSVPNRDFVIVGPPDNPWEVNFRGVTVSFLPDQADLAGLSPLEGIQSELYGPVYVDRQQRLYFAKRREPVAADLVRAETRRTEEREVRWFSTQPQMRAETRADDLLPGLKRAASRAAYEMVGSFQDSLIFQHARAEEIGLVYQAPATQESEGDEHAKITLTFRGEK